MQERRRIPRTRTYLGGLVAFNERCSTMECLVRNMSPDGAKLVFGGTVEIPAEFDIMIRKRGESRRARIVWRQETEAGVTFPAPEGRKVVSIESARRIRELEAEREALRKRVAQLSEPM
jgi:DNA modification methylase